MSDLISRADAIEAVRQFYEKYNGDLGVMVLKAESVINIIEALPSADAVDYGEYILKADDRLGADVIYCSPEIAENVVKVVRCKDCHWYENRYGEVCHNPRYGDGHANYSPPYVDEEYWCKDGERREP